MKTDIHIAHMLSANAPHLNRRLSSSLVQYITSGCIYVSNAHGNRYASNFSIANKEWLSQLRPENAGGILTAALWVDWRPFRKGRLAAWIRLFLPVFSLKSLMSIIRGPKNWVIHGYALPLGTILFFRMFAKRVVVINWGGPPTVRRRLRVFDILALRLHYKFFLLMDSELSYFKYAKRVEVRPYPCGCFNGVVPDMDTKADESNSLILGNSTWSRDAYRRILDRLVPGEWSRIVCMLNYGDEENQEATDDFIRQYKSKFGASFYAWTTTIPFDEYVKIMSEPSFYISPGRYQTGLGAIYQSIKMGKTILVCGDNYKWLTGLGVKVIDLDKMADFGFKTINSMRIDTDTAKRNFALMKALFDKKFSKENWINAIIDAFK